MNVVIKDRGREVWLNVKHAVYRTTIENAFEYFWGAVETEEGVADFSRPKLHRVVGFEDFPILLPSIPEPYVTCRQYLDFLQIRPGQLVFDLGGYCGLTAIAFAKAGARVVVLEPDPENYGACQHNIAECRESHDIVPVSAAIGGKSGVIQFTAEGAPGSGNAAIVNRNIERVITVPCITLEDMVRDYGVPDAIKMDIEGAEHELIGRASGFFGSHKPRLVIEAHPVAGVNITNDLCRHLEGYGYACEVVSQTGHFFPLVTAEQKGVGHGI